MSDLNAKGRRSAAASISDESGRRVLKLTGELDLSTAGDVQRAIDTLIAQAPEHVVVDLSEVTFMDSSGIALLLQLATRLHRTELRNPSPLIRQVIDMTGLAETLPVIP